MTTWNAVMRDETGCEFHANSVEADTRDEAWDLFADDYPESTVVEVWREGETNPTTARAEEYAQRCLDDPYYDIDHCHEWEY